MFYRDNRLSPIHEGITCIKSLDLLARKLPMNNLACYLATLAEMKKILAIAREHESLACYCDELDAAITNLKQTSNTLL